MASPLTYNPSIDGIVFSRPIGGLYWNIDGRSEYPDTDRFVRRPFQSLAFVKSYFNNEEFRRGMFSIYVNETGVLNESTGYLEGGVTKEYWWKEEDLSDDGLVEKTSDLTSYATLNYVNNEISGLNTLINNEASTRLSEDDLIKQSISDLADTFVQDVILTVDDLDVDQKTYSNVNLAGRSLSIYSDSVNRYLIEDTEYTILEEGGFVLTDAIGAGDILRLQGTAVARELVAKTDITYIDVNINRFDVSSMVGAGFISGAEGVSFIPLSTWSVGWKIPLTEDVNYIYLSGWNTTRREIAFFNGEIPDDDQDPSQDFDSQLLSKLEPVKTGGKATVAKPEGATWFAVQILADPELPTVYEEFQVTFNQSYEEYIPYDPLLKEIIGIGLNVIRNADKEVYSKSEVYNKTEIDEITPSINEFDLNVNKFNPATMIGVGLVKSGVNIGLSPGADWRIACRIPLTEDVTTIYFSGWNSTRREIGFFNGEIPPLGIDGQQPIVDSTYDAQWLSKLIPTKVDGAVSVPKPEGATWFAVNIMSPTDVGVSVFENFQITYNTAASYRPYDSNDKIATEINSKPISASKMTDADGNFYTFEDIINSDASSVGIEVEFTGTRYVNLKYRKDGTDRLEVLNVFRTPAVDNSTVFDWSEYYVDGVLKRDTPDDSAPYRIMGTTIGAEHGYVKTRGTQTAHGKQNVDVGSIWSDGTKQFVLVNIFSVNEIDVSSRTDNTDLTVNTLTHVSGATNTSDIVFTARTTNKQMYPAIKNRTIDVLVDGVKVENPTVEGKANAKKSVVFNESYDIMTKSSIMEWFITQVGTVTPIVEYQGTAIATVDISYCFTRDAGCTIYTGILALGNISEFLDVMFVMAIKLEGNFSYYVPTSVPTTYQSVSYDFRQPTDLSAVTMATDINFASTRLQATGLYGDRLLMIGEDVGLAIGYLPVRDTDMSVRRTNAARKALQIAPTRKVYMSAIDSASITTMPQGTYYSTIAYKNYFTVNSERTAQYYIETPDGTYMYVDWHTVKMDKIDIPEWCYGKTYEVVEKTSNVTILGLTTFNINVNIDNTLDYGYLIIKFS